MKKKDFQATIVLEKSSRDVFKTITDDVAKWWGGKDLEGSTTKLNDEFVIHHPGAHYSKQKLVEVIPGKKVVWVTTESIRKTDNYDWTGTKFIFELTPKGDNTLLKFIYDGVVLENESDRLVQICDMTIKEIFYNFITYGKAK